jgi:hypothetical protein
MNIERGKDMNFRIHKKKRIGYAITFLVLFIMETLIALYVHDDIIRPYIGDMLVVILIYCFIRIIIPMGYKWLPFYIFLFAAGIECLQYFHLVQLLGLQEYTFWRIVIGSTFDLKDIMCYGVGCILLSLCTYLWDI